MHDLRSEISDINRKITGYEESIEKMKMDRMNILKTCKLENVKLPFNYGSLDSIRMDDEDDDESENQDEVLMEIELNYNSLKEEYTNLGTVDEIDSFFNTKIDALTTEITGLNPNQKARERLDDAEVRLDDINSEFSSARNVEKQIDNEFEAVKKQRYELFMNAFNHISNQIDGIYKELTRSTVSPLGGSAYLTLEDEDEPYLSGIKYHAMPPMKRFRDMELLSGGEKTIAALALLFAIHSYHPSPFFVLDEVDAALDNANVARIAAYITRHSGPDFQFIVIIRRL
ncbi:unnamed protein product [Ambrosiozyma monospora]|uniref:Unnamed protein product n=1 Tax=Ambrosiozyma monospora TaxID=43982 RepID=A0ACB5TVW0_AMBMO|nr:unnamed protein product [Ambrosiozyma monospora]